MSDSDDKVCKKEACDIQTCLRSNDYQQSMCAAAVQALIECCRSTTVPVVHCAFPAKKNVKK